MTPRKPRHPVWDVYDEFRTARFCVNYFSSELRSATRATRWIQGVIAASSSSSVAGIWLFQGALGGLVWKGLGALGAVLAVIQLVSKPAEYCVQLERCITAYRGLELELGRIVRRIRFEGTYTEKAMLEFERVMESKAQIVIDTAKLPSNDKLREKCYEQTLVELPASRLFVPEDQG